MNPVIVFFIPQGCQRALAFERTGIARQRQLPEHPAESERLALPTAGLDCMPRSRTHATVT